MDDVSPVLITRQHVQNMLPMMGLSPEHEARLLALPYPVDVSVVAAALESFDIDLGTLTDRMGGSP